MSSATCCSTHRRRGCGGEPALGGVAPGRGTSGSASPSSPPSADERFALGVETIYEGYLVHYGRPRLFAPADADAALLLGDYLYAHGLVRVAATGDVAAVARPRRADLAVRPGPRGRPAGRRRRLGSDGGRARGRARLDGARGALRDDGDPGQLEAVAARPRRATRRSTLRSRRTAAGWDRVGAMLAALDRCSPDAAEEGKKVVLSMLVVGLVFLAVIVLGDGLHYLAQKRQREKASRPL